MPKKTIRNSLACIILPLLLISCARSDPIESQNAKPSPAPLIQSSTSRLPDFSALVVQEGPSVVNISTTSTMHSNGAPGLLLPGIPENDPFYDFFQRMIPPGPSEYQTQSLGSGFIISHDGYILTNAHVVENADEIKVKLTDKREFKAKVVGSDARTDVALLKIDAKGLPAVTVGDPSKLRVGEWVAAIGSPFGFENSITAGIVSAKGRSLPDENYVPFIQTDVPINPGNSGGPLFNMQGQVVGINSQIFSHSGGYMGLSFAIPIDVAMNVTDQLRQHGKVSRGRLGIGIQDLSVDLASSFGLSRPNGALVASVEKGSPGDKAGLAVGDVILIFDGKNIQDANQLPILVAAVKPGTRVKMHIWHKGSAKDIEIMVGELPAESTGQASHSAPAAENPLGLVLGETTPAQQQQLGIDHGLVVEEATGLSARAGIRPGDVILAINSTEITSLSQANRLLAQGRSTASIALLIKRGNIIMFVPIKPNRG